MKTLKCLAAAMALLCFVSAQAQFIPSTNPEFVAGVLSSTVAPTRIASDAKFYRNVPGGPLQLVNMMAWDGTTSGMYYFVNFGGPSGAIGLPGPLRQPDLIITNDNNFLNTYMILVYIDNANSNFVYVLYTWTGSTFAPVISTIWFDVAGPYSSSINIDATGNGDYAIVLGRSDGSIEVFSGVNSGLPGLPTSVATLPVASGHHTDICVNSTMAASTNVHISYTDLNDKTLFTASAPFGSSPLTPVVVSASSIPGTYADPRIASNIINSSICPADDIFSIIYDSVAGTNSFVNLYSEENGGPYYAGLTAGNSGFPWLPLTQPRRPVVTYDEAYEFFMAPCSGQLITAWTDGSSVTNGSILGEKLQGNGTIWGTPDYYDATNPSRPNCDLASISSKYAGDRVLLAFYDVTANLVKYKNFGYGDPTMRIAKNNTIASAAEADKDLEVYPNPASDHIYLDYKGMQPDVLMHMQVTDLTGRVYASFNETVAVLQNRADNWFSLLAPGVYFLKSSDDAGFNKTLKLVKK